MTSRPARRPRRTPSWMPRPRPTLDATRVAGCRRTRRRDDRARRDRGAVARHPADHRDRATPTVSGRASWSPSTRGPEFVRASRRRRGRRRWPTIAERQRRTRQAGRGADRAGDDRRRRDDRRCSPTSRRWPDAAAAARRGRRLRAGADRGAVRRPAHRADRRRAGRRLPGASPSALGGKPITIRTWDIGGDKPLPFLPQAARRTRSSGERRASRVVPRVDPETAARPARSRSAGPLAETPVQVMFPMVTTADEVAGRSGSCDRAAGGSRARTGSRSGSWSRSRRRRWRIDLARRRARLRQHRHQRPHPVHDRRRPRQRRRRRPGRLARPGRPAADRPRLPAAPDGVEVAVCGDLASRPEATALLLGLGVDELSCTPPQVPEIKAAVAYGPTWRRRGLLAAKVLDARRPG